MLINSIIEMDQDKLAQLANPNTATDINVNGDGESHDNMSRIDSSNATSSSGSTDDIVVLATPPERQEQFNILRNSIIARLELASTLYLVPTKWYDAFNSWARGTTSQEPGRVNPVATLCDADGVLLDDAVEGRDWQAANEEGWSMIKRW
jgi:hypothetical protein